MIQVVYEDNHVLVFDKPAGMATQPDAIEAAKDWLKKKYHKPGAVFLEPIHRLDKPVQGLVLCARTSKALSRLQESMRERKIAKKYQAQVSREPLESQGTLRHFLIHDEFRARISKEGKEAVLHYRKIGDHLLEIDLETGRYHQIRAQLAAIGCPIIGDVKYGGVKAREGMINLAHVQLSFPHPVTHELITLEKPAPKFVQH